MEILIYNNFQELYTTFLCNYIQEGAKKHPFGYAKLEILGKCTRDFL